MLLDELLQGKIALTIPIYSVYWGQCPGEGNHPLASEAGGDGPPRSDADGP